MSLKSIKRSKISDEWNQLWMIPEKKAYRPWLPSAPPLSDQASEIVNNFPLPNCWQWKTDDVIKWLRNTIGLPQYKDSFVKNFIDGRRLLLVDASVCPKIGIRDFEHAKRITAGIRELYNVEQGKSKRSISLPPCYPLTHYLLFRVPTGPNRENTTRVQLFRMMGILDEEKPCPFDHWQMINPIQPDFPCNRFGGTTRKNVYRRTEHPRQTSGHSYLRWSNSKPNYFFRIDVK